MYKKLVKKNNNNMDLRKKYFENVAEIRKKGYLVEFDSETKNKMFEQCMDAPSLLIDERTKDLITIGSGGDIDAFMADKVLHETIEKYKSERKKYMSNKENLGKEFLKILSENASNFRNWVDMTNTVLDIIGDLNIEMDKMQNVDFSLNDIDKRKIVSVDTIEIDLNKIEIDVSKWEDTIKPVKIIMSVITRDNNGEDSFGLSIEAGNMVALMEDGTFRL